MDRRAEVADRRAAVPGDVAPAAAPDHPERGPSDQLTTVILFVNSLFVVDALRPLPDIPMHIKQPQIIRLQRSARMRLTQRIANKPPVPLQQFRRLPKAVTYRRSRPTRILPFRFHR